MLRHDPRAVLILAYCVAQMSHVAKSLLIQWQLLIVSACCTAPAARMQADAGRLFIWMQNLRTLHRATNLLSSCANAARGLQAACAVMQAEPLQPMRLQLMWPSQTLGPLWQQLDPCAIHSHVRFCDV